MATPVVTQEQQFYSVSGLNIHTLREDLAQKGPINPSLQKRFHARTESKVRWDFTYKTTTSGCAIDTVKVVMHIVMKLPQWTDFSAASSELQDKWNRYMHHLIIHENGHAEAYRQQARAIEDKLHQLGNHPHCEALAHDAHAAANKLIRETENWDEDYDRTTQFGATQGAVF